MEAHVDGRDVVALQKLPEIRVHVRNRILLRYAAGLGRVDVGNRNDLGIRYFLPIGIQMVLADLSHADDANTYLVTHVHPISVI